MKFFRFRHLSLLACTGGLLTLTLPAQANPVAQQLIHASGTLQAAAETCKDYDTSRLEQLQAEQRAAAGALGVSTADFDKQFQASYLQAKAQISAASAEEVATMCSKLKEIPAH